VTPSALRGPSALDTPGLRAFAGAVPPSREPSLSLDASSLSVHAPPSVSVHAPPSARGVVVVGGLLLLLLLAACAPGVNEAAGSVAPTGEGPFGFWWGLWHGVIAPITFIVSLFSETVGVYEIHNTGGWYDFGFLAGLSLTFGGPGGAAARGRR
jgi:hypothetical protein